MKQYFLNIWNSLSTVFIGMKVTFKHLFVPSVTIQYPEVKLQLPERERNRLYMNMDDCIGCDQCARACPVNCIEIETVKSLPEEDLGKTSNGKKKALWVTKFDIDFAKCCYCQLCVFPCPTECIYMTDVYEFTEFERKDLIYSFVTLTPSEIEEKKNNFAKLEAEKAAKKAEAAAEAAKKKAEAAKAAESPKPSLKTEMKKVNKFYENFSTKNDFKMVYW
jgi:NADH-quinone oxidoreductase subunit I